MLSSSLCLSLIVGCLPSWCWTVFSQRHLWMGLALCHCWRYTLNGCFEKKPCIFLASASEVHLFMHDLTGNVIGTRKCYFCLGQKYKLVIFAPCPNPWIFVMSESNPVPNAVCEITSQLNIKLELIKICLNEYLYFWMNFIVVALLCMIFRTVSDSHRGHIPHKIFQVKNNQLYIYFKLFSALPL